MSCSLRCLSISSILVSRMILNIRQHAYVGHPQSVSLGSFVSGIEFLPEMMEQDSDRGDRDTGGIDYKSQTRGITSQLEVPAIMGV